MVIRKIDENGDWYFGKDSLLKDEMALKLNLLTKYRTFLGECFSDSREGLDLLSAINLKSKEYLENNIREITLKLPEVIKINSINTEIYNDGTAKIHVNVSSSFGNIDVQDQLDIKSIEAKI